MEASSVTGLLTTNGTSKYFYGSSIPEAAVLYYMGKLTTNNGTSPSAGICYKAYGGYYEAVHRSTYESGVWKASENLSASNLMDSTKYFGFINGEGTNGTSGALQYWYWDTSK